MKSIQFFLAFLLTGFLLSFIHLFFRFKKWSHWHGKKLYIIQSGLIFCFISVIFGMFFMRQHPEHMREWDLLSYTIFSLMGILVSLIFYTFFAEAFLLLEKIIDRFKTQKNSPQNIINQDRRRFLSISAATAGSVAIGSVQASGDPQINHIIVKIKNLPHEFSGFKIAQVTDLHIGPMIDKNYVKRVVELTNSLNADLIALTGDIADGPIVSIKDDVSPLNQLKAKDGVFFITGNHEYYWGAETWINEFKNMGFNTLLNQHVVLRRDSAELVLAGVTDHEAHRHIEAHTSSPEKALIGAPNNTTKILLAHQPKSYVLASAAKFDLQISGHTHGGQFFPWSLFVALAQPYYRGLNKHKDMWIYTSTGTGFWGPPLRFAVPKEIALIELQSESAIS